jgi:hypothetical protein
LLKKLSLPFVFERAAALSSSPAQHADGPLIFQFCLELHLPSFLKLAAGGIHIGLGEKITF